MSMKEIDNKNAMKVNATEDNIYIITTTLIHANKYIEHDPNKPTTKSIRERQLCECINNK